MDSLQYVTNNEHTTNNKTQQMYLLRCRATKLRLLFEQAQRDPADQFPFFGTICSYVGELHHNSLHNCLFFFMSNQMLALFISCTKVSIYIIQGQFYASGSKVTIYIIQCQYISKLNPGMSIYPKTFNEALSI